MTRLVAFGIDVTSSAPFASSLRMMPINPLHERFETDRPRLRAVATRMLGSVSEADDALQEAWLRLDRAEDVENPSGWLTTVVARVCLDALRARTARREEPFGLHEPSRDDDPEAAAILGDAVGGAMLVVLETLSPAERVAFVLHDVFGVAFEEIAPVVDRSVEAARQLASRARRRVRSGGVPDADPARRREIVEAFLLAARGGDLAGLLAILDPDVVLRADAAATKLGAHAEVRGANAVARTFSGRAAAAQRVLVDGQASLAWVQNGTLRVVFDFTIVEGRIVALDLVADPERHAAMELTFLDA